MEILIRHCLLVSLIIFFGYIYGNTFTPIFSSKHLQDLSCVLLVLLGGDPHSLCFMLQCSGGRSISWSFVPSCLSILLSTGIGMTHLMGEFGSRWFVLAPKFNFFQMWLLSWRVPLGLLFAMRTYYQGTLASWTGLQLSTPLLGKVWKKF